MSVVMTFLPTILVMLAVVIAAAPWGAASGASFVLHVMPYMMAHLFLARGKGFMPSPVMFFAGLAMDMVSDSPLGFWAWIYLFGVLVARQLPDGLVHSQFGRLTGLLLIVFALTAAQVGLASLYQLRWIGWHEVLAGTLVAGCIAALLDLGWSVGQPKRSINVTAHGVDGRSGHV
jgi:rod shape-determining protein MreD